MYCPMCRQVGTCDRCRRLNSIGLMMDSLKVIARDGGDQVRPFVDALVGEIGLLMVERSRMVEAFRRDARDEARYAAQDARAAFDEGTRKGYDS